MVHIFIFIQILALFLCAGIFWGVRSIGKSSPDPYFFPLLAYTGFTTAGILLNVLSTYLNANIENFKGNFSATAWTVAGFILMCGSVLALGAFLFRLKGKKPHPGAVAAAAAFLSVSGILHLTGIVVYLIDAPPVHICLYRGVMLSPVILILAVLIWILVSAGSGTLPKGGRSVIVRLLVGYAVLALFWISTWYREQLNPVIRLGLLGIVYFWYRALRNVSRPEAVPEIETMVEILGEKYDLSKREKEVLALLLGGKKNREIEASLFLSSSTVRNHISSLYGKIGIDSRGQLTSLALKLRKS